MAGVIFQCPFDLVLLNVLFNCVPGWHLFWLGGGETVSRNHYFGGGGINKVFVFLKCFPPTPPPKPCGIETMQRNLSLEIVCCCCPPKKNTFLTLLCLKFIVSVDFVEQLIWAGFAFHMRPLELRSNWKGGDARLFLFRELFAGRFLVFSVFRFLKLGALVLAEVYASCLQTAKGGPPMQVTRTNLSRSSASWATS